MRRSRPSNAARGMAARNRMQGTNVRRLLLMVLCSGVIAASFGFRPGGGARVHASRHTQAGARRDSSAPESIWQEFAKDMAARPAQRPALPQRYRRLHLNSTGLAGLLRQAPPEFSAAARNTETVVALPLPDGSFGRFRVQASSILEPALAARFPALKTYRGQGLDDPTATTRFDWTPAGLHAIILSAHGTAYIEPYAADDNETYLAYAHQDIAAESGALACAVTEAEQTEAIKRAGAHAQSSSVTPRVVSGATLRTYRLAVAATAEYTQTYGGGTVNGALAAITTTINLVDAIYERDAAIRLVLIAGETSIIFTDTATDGYTTDNVGALISENQTRLDAVIGTANYDVGHVFDGRLLGGGSYSFQGQAGIGVVCTASKGRGATVFRSVFPSEIIAYYIAAHEMGHQFGATHTFNANIGDCGIQRAAATAYEPGTGTTIMGYRFNCGSEDLRSADTYFHTASLEQFVNYTTSGNGSGCPTQTATGNNSPAVNAGASYTIPARTPFKLTATGSDPDGDALAYTWEEFDLGPSSPPDADDGARPLFRSFAPTTNPARTFPQLTDILTNAQTFGESLPTTTRTLNFRVTARDNRAGGGGIATAATQVSVRADSGPFIVTAPASGTSWPGNTLQTVTWNVANTASAPVSCASVRILFSTDGGHTFPFVLADGTPNDGTEAVAVPNLPTSMARIKVEAAGNVFFDISHANFTVTQGVSCSYAVNPPTLPVFPAAGGQGSFDILTSPACAWRALSLTSWLTLTNSSGMGNGTVSFTVAPNPRLARDGSILYPSDSFYFISQAAGAATTVEFQSNAFSFNEGNGRATITVLRHGNLTGTTSVDYQTVDDPAAVRCDTANSIAYARCDYATTIDTLTFAPGETSKSFTIPLIDDAHVEGPETVQLRLLNPSGAALDLYSAAPLTLNDNDAAGAANPVFTTPFFVRMQYLDFLSREPEAGEPWTGILNGCADVNNLDPNSASAACDRINVSSSFFGSPEFQLKGFYVFLFYKAALNRLPGYTEIIPDMRNVTGQTPQEVFNKRAAFATAFSQRAEFANTYASLANDAYVAALLNRYALTSINTPDPANPDGTTMVTLTQTELVNRLNTQTLTRAQVLRALVQSREINRREFNSAFVAMQYYGYLRRTPEDAGYQSWLSYLTTHPDDARTMINGFMNSTEYRLRFGRAQ